MMSSQLHLLLFPQMLSTVSHSLCRNSPFSKVHFILSRTELYLRDHKPLYKIELSFPLFTA